MTSVMPGRDDEPSAGQPAGLDRRGSERRRSRCEAGRPGAMAYTSRPWLPLSVSPCLQPARCRSPRPVTPSGSWPMTRPAGPMPMMAMPFRRSPGHDLLEPRPASPARPGESTPTRLATAWASDRNEVDRVVRGPRSARAGSCRARRARARRRRCRGWRWRCGVASPVSPARESVRRRPRRDFAAMRSSEPVPDAPHRGQWQPVAELLAELAHMDVDRAVVAVPVGSPHAVEQLSPAQRQPGSARPGTAAGRTRVPRAGRPRRRAGPRDGRCRSRHRRRRGPRTRVCTPSVRRRMALTRATSSRGENGLVT